MKGHQITCLSDDNPATVIQNVVTIDKTLKSWAYKLLPKDKPVVIEHGPHCIFDVDRTWTYKMLLGGIYSHAGPLEQHVDGAGNTFGLVLINEGNHRLDINGQLWEMPEGSVFHINSNLDHGTQCDEPNGLLMIGTIDLFHVNLPAKVTYEEIGISILQKIQKKMK